MPDKIITKTRVRSVIAFFCGVVIVVGGSLVGQPVAGVTPVLERVIPQKMDSVATPSLGYPVAGIVRSTNEQYIRAERAGTVAEVLVAEGDLVTDGESLGTVLDPVLFARLARQVAQNEVSRLLTVEGVRSSAERAAVSERAAHAATERATTNESAVERRVEVATASGEVALRQIAVAVPTVLRFAQDNRSYFTSESADSYRRVVLALYGREPNYLRFNSILSGAETSSGLISRLTTISSPRSPADIEGLLRETNPVLIELEQVFVAAETEFLDRSTVATTDERYEGYVNARAEVVALQATVNRALAALTAARDERELSLLDQSSATEVAALIARYATEGVSLATAVRESTLALGVAEQEVVEVEIAQGTLRAPSAGVIRRVLVEPGEYVLPGTPLLEFVGTKAQEVVVTVPASVLPEIAVGMPFLRAGQVVGEVDRIAPVRAGGSGEVFLSLREPLSLGSVVRGELPLRADSSTSTRAITRSMLRFSGSGPYVMTTSGEYVAVTIVHDAGDHLLVTPAMPLTTDLQVATGIRLK